YFTIASWRGQVEQAAVEILLQHAKNKVGILAPKPPSGDAFFALSFTNPWIIAIKDGHRGRRVTSEKFAEQALFSCEIFFHGVMVIEMIARKVGEDRNREGNAVGARL